MFSKMLCKQKIISFLLWKTIYFLEPSNPSLSDLECDVASDEIKNSEKCVQFRANMEKQIEKISESKSMHVRYVS